MIRYVGLDVHKHFLEVCIIDRKGQVLWRGRVDCGREPLIQFARDQLKKADRVALEATTNTWPVVDLIKPHVQQLVVGNPLKTKAIAEANIKTDKIDAEVLAQLLRCGYLSEVWQPHARIQDWRTLITHRSSLMTQRGRHKNRIQSLLGRLLLVPPCKCLWTKAGRAWLKTLELAWVERLLLESELRQLDQVEQELVTLDQKLSGIAAEEPQVKLLMTMPGVNYVVALGLLAALGDISRFPDGDHAAAYLGLVPRTQQSGSKCYHGQITKAGNPQGRWLLTQACQHVSRHPGPLGAFFRRLAKRKPRQVAIMALARKVVTVALLMLKQNEPYRYAKPDLMATKFTELRRKSQPSPRTSLQPGQKSPPSLKPAAREGLSAVYQAVGLPGVKNPEALPPGEQQMLRDRQLEEIVQGLYQPASSTATSPSRQKPGRSKK